MVHSHGVITGAGFETPAEALYLGKNLLVLPIKGQYEQACNAAALKDFNVTVVEQIDTDFDRSIVKWLEASPAIPLQIIQDTHQIVQTAIEKARALQKMPSLLNERLLTEEDFAAMF